MGESMLKIIAWTVSGLAAGFLIALATGLIGKNDADNNVSSESGTRYSRADDSLEARIATLEIQLLEERIEREQLQDTLDNLLVDQWMNLGQTLEPEISPRQARRDDNENQSPAQRQEEFRARAEQRQANLQARRTQRLEEAGFPPEQAAWILQREEEMRLENLNAQWERRRQAFLEDDGNMQRNPLRDEMGDADYERYLEATGRPTNVYVSNLVDNSQAKSAGFQTGDEIVRYNGQRVFNFNELNMVNVQGELGEPVIVDIVRDGVPMQLTVERGPLGIVGGRRRGRGR